MTDVKLKKYYLIIIIVLICIFNIIIYLFFSKQLEIYTIESMAQSSAMNLINQ